MDQKNEHDYHDADDEQYAFHAHGGSTFRFSYATVELVSEKSNQGTGGGSYPNDHTGGHSGQSSLGGEFQHSRRGAASPADTGANGRRGSRFDLLFSGFLHYFRILAYFEKFVFFGC
jgi:hypothetical protein